MQQERSAGSRVEADPALYTYEDLLAMPEDRYRKELFTGELTVTPAPSPQHQEIVLSLATCLQPHVKRHDLGKVFVAPVDVILAPTTVLEPDLIFVSRERLDRISDRGIEGSPDLVVEVVSKGTRSRDRETKRALYERFGVSCYWVLDPFTKTLEELVLKRKRYARRTTLTGSKRFEAACFPGLKIPLGKVWV